jgi:hypothetical protein
MLRAAVQHKRLLDVSIAVGGFHRFASRLCSQRIFATHTMHGTTHTEVSPKHNRRQATEHACMQVCTAQKQSVAPKWRRVWWRQPQASSAALSPPHIPDTPFAASYGPPTFSPLHTAQPDPKASIRCTPQTTHSLHTFACLLVVCWNAYFWSFSRSSAASFSSPVCSTFTRVR